MGSDFANLAKLPSKPGSKTKKRPERCGSGRLAASLELALVLLEEIEARGQRFDLVLAGLLPEAFDEAVRVLEDVVPAEELGGIDVEVLADELAAGGDDAVHENRGHAQFLERIDQSLLHGRVVAGILGGLGGVAPALVGGAQQLIAYGERVMRLELVHDLLELERSLLAFVHHLVGRGACRDAAGAVGRIVAVLGGHAIEARARQAVEYAREQGAFLEGGVDHALVVAGADLVAVLVLAGHARVICLGAETHRLFR